MSIKTRSLCSAKDYLPIRSLPNRSLHNDVPLRLPERPLRAIGPPDWLLSRKARRNNEDPGGGKPAENNVFQALHFSIFERRDRNRHRSGSDLQRAPRPLGPPYTRLVLGVASVFESELKVLLES